MAAKGKSYAEMWSRWEIAISNLKEHAGDMPHLTDDVTQLDQTLTQVRDLANKQEDLRGQTREINAKLRDLTKAGEKVRSRLGANLAGKFGFTSETLVKFGFRPRRIPRRTKTVEKPAPEPPPPAGPVESKPPGGAK
ncbi:MAG: hypothetical protein DMF53_08070 [Acidobacteria bacterium]|nr:MAG: hypothetical protein DMF53_08070 [Acidobacteriota bacterium]